MAPGDLKELLTEYIEVSKNNQNLFKNHAKLFPKSNPKYTTAAWKKNGTPKVAMTYDALSGEKYKNKSKRKYNEYRGLTVQRGSTRSGYLSSGNMADYLAFPNRNEKQTVDLGIYPIYNYDYDKDILYLYYGISNTKTPTPTWKFSPAGDKLPDHIYKSYNNASTNYTTWDYDKMLSDLDDMIDDYEIALGIDRTQRADGTEGLGTGNILAPSGTGHGGEKRDDKNHSHPLNLILYGPPGTGKTYNTLFKALEIIEGKTKKELEKEKKDLDDQWEKDTNKPKTVKKGYEVLKGRYDNYVKTGQIVFTTFHQSMSYEDFIEGIKPIPVSGKDEKDKIIAIHKNENPSSKNPQFGDGVTTITDPTRMKYEVKDGIFKHLCKYDITIIYNIFKNVYPISKSFSYFSSRKVDLPITDYKDEELVFYYKFGNQNPRPVYVKAMEGMLEQNADFDINKYMEISTGKPSKSKNPDRGLAVYLKEFYNKFLEIKNKWPRILIIDEINRGNVAQIFGELITLIEPSKRLANNEAMTATLPYSQKPFGVPNNLYIIGTMNTADRSVEALDTALRRRFSFEEIMPRPELLGDTEVCDVKLSDLLKTINARIVALKDREHQIGHSYFMGCPDDKAKAETWLSGVFKDKIIPLLQEYFYGDYKNIYYVLGEEFVRKVSSNKADVFSVEIDDDIDWDDNMERYEIKSFDENAEVDNKIDIGKAVKSLTKSVTVKRIEKRKNQLKDKGYKDEDIEKILKGEPESNFTPEKKENGDN